MLSIKCLNDNSRINLLENYEYPVSAYVIISSINTKIKEKYNIDILNDLEIYKELDEKQNKLLGKDTEIYGSEKLLIKINEISYNKLVSCYEKELQKDQKEICLLMDELKIIKQIIGSSSKEIENQIEKLEKMNNIISDKHKCILKKISQIMSESDDLYDSLEYLSQTEKEYLLEKDADFKKLSQTEKKYLLQTAADFKKNEELIIELKNELWYRNIEFSDDFHSFQSSTKSKSDIFSLYGKKPSRYRMDELNNLIVKKTNSLNSKKKSKNFLGKRVSPLSLAFV